MMDFTGVYILLGMLLLMGLGLLALWLLRCAALYRLTVNAGATGTIRFLAWVPVANHYLLGVLCDRAAWRHGARSWRFRLLLPILGALGSPWLYVLLTYLLSYQNPLWDANIWVFQSGLQSVLGLAFWLLSSLSLYHLYWDYAPGKEGVYTALSVVFPFAAPAVCLFLVRWNIPLSVREPLNIHTLPPKEETRHDF